MKTYTHSCIIGHDELGREVSLDIGHARHILIAGVPGSGKTALVHTLITSHISISPDSLSLCIIDSKQLELNRYNTIPQLLTPVLTDMKKAVLVLRWLAKEMTRRIDVFKKKNIISYGEYSSTDDIMPRLCYIADSIDIMIERYPKETPPLLENIAEMGHVVGIHLILTMGTTSIKKIPQSLLQHIPTRFVAALPSKTASVHILGHAGAELLVQPGDMLYKQSSFKFPLCIRTVIPTEVEIKKAIKTAEKAFTKIGGVYSDEDVEHDDSDALYYEARAVVVESGKASTSYLQRKLGIGYSHAARLMDLLEYNNIIGPANGASPREVNKK